MSLPNRLHSLMIGVNVDLGMQTSTPSAAREPKNPL